MKIGCIPSLLLVQVSLAFHQYLKHLEVPNKPKNNYFYGNFMALTAGFDCKHVSFILTG